MCGGTHRDINHARHVTQSRSASLPIYGKTWHIKSMMHSHVTSYQNSECKSKWECECKSNVSVQHILHLTSNSKVTQWIALRSIFLHLYDRRRTRRTLRTVFICECFQYLNIYSWLVVSSCARARYHSRAILSGSEMILRKVRYDYTQ